MLNDMYKKHQALGEKIDVCGDNADLKGLSKLIDVLDVEIKKEAGSVERALLYYFKSNIYSEINSIQNKSNGWGWESASQEKNIANLRMARFYVDSSDYEEGVEALKCKIYTNLGNALSTVGRYVEAIDVWEQVADRYNFGMALGNLGQSLEAYAIHSYDPSHQYYLLQYARKNIKKAFENGVERHAVEGFRNVLKNLESYLDEEDLALDDSFSLGRSRREIAYKKWCLENKLFINPLNDIVRCSVAAHDVLTVPNIRVEISTSSWRPPVCYAIYNQIKQEVIAARYTLFEGIEGFEKKDGRSHFSDKDVFLYDMMDHRVYGIWVEKVKMAILMAYTAFDKIAYLVNYYWGRGLKERDISINRVWSSNSGKSLAKIFVDRKNYPLRGLYWLSKDLGYYKDKDVDEENLKPEASVLCDIRNHLGHKYLAVYDDIAFSFSDMWEADGLAYPISESELIQKATSLIRLARNALVYISAAIHIEEMQHEDSNVMLGGMELKLWKKGAR